MKKKNVFEKLKLINEPWTPKIIDQFNDNHIKLAKFQGEFTWHSHEETDEVFYVLNGEMTILFRDRSIELKTGDLLTVPKGVEHKPVAKESCDVLLIEPAGTVNTGNAGGDQTASNSEWL